jgi:heat shock protein HslJ
MASSLLDGLKGLVIPELLSSAARNLGESEGSVGTGFGAAFASILAGLAGKAGNPQALKPFFDLITSPADDGSVLRNPALAADAASGHSPLGELGESLLSNLFGPQLSSVDDLVSRSTGLRSGTGLPILRMAAPLLLGFLAKRISSERLNLAGFSNLLLTERNQIMRAVPTGLTSVLGLTGLRREADIAAAHGVTRPEVSRTPRWLWPALAALVVILGAWLLARARRAPVPDQTVGAVSGPVMDTFEPPAAEANLPPDVVAVTWEWVSFTTPVEQLQIDGPALYTLRFGDDGRVAVRADCNRGSAGYSVGADRQLTFNPMALTQAACRPGSLSDRFVKEVGRASSYFMKDGDLYLSLPVDSGTLRFRRQRET